MLIKVTVLEHVHHEFVVDAPDEEHAQMDAEALMRGETLPFHTHTREVPLWEVVDVCDYEAVE